MIHYLPNNAETENQLNSALEIIRDPENWCKGKMRQGNAFCINGALYAAGMPNTPILRISSHQTTYICETI